MIYTFAPISCAATARADPMLARIERALRCAGLLVAAVMLSWGGELAAQQPDATDHLVREDLRVAAIAERLLTANRALCRTNMPVTGMILHSRDQYGSGTIDAFADGPLAISAVVAGSPAERAGLRRGDAIVAFGEQQVEPVDTPGALLRDRAFEQLAQMSASQPIELAIKRDGAPLAVLLEPVPGCRALVEVLTEEGRIARSDGRVIQVSYGLTSGLSDAGLAATLAHELAHLVLEHRRRLSEAGVKKGLLAEFGTNRRRNREAEVEADRLSVHLLANGGFDPAIGPRFWISEEGRRSDAGIFRSTIYPSPSKRAGIMQTEIDEHLGTDGRPSLAAHLTDRRDQAF